MQKLIGPIVFLFFSIAFLVFVEFLPKRHTSPLVMSSKTTTIKRDMNITSSAFANNQPIPQKYSCEGDNTNPPLQFIDIPKNAESLVLIVDDPDAPMGIFVHWVVYNISPTTRFIAEHAKMASGIEGVNGTGKPGFIGPCPPSGTHRYFFKLYALDTSLHLSSTVNKQAVEQAMQGHILDQAELIGLYSRK